MTKDEANHLAEGDRVKSRQLRGTVVGTTANCVSFQWDGRATPESYRRRHAAHQQRGEVKASTSPSAVLGAVVKGELQTSRARRCNRSKDSPRWPETEGCTSEGDQDSIWS